MKTRDLDIIAKNIKKMFEDKKIKTTKEASEYTSIPYTTLNPIINADRDFKISSFIQICKTLKCSPIDLLDNVITFSTEVITESANARYLAVIIPSPGMTFICINDLYSSQKSKAFTSVSFNAKDDAKELADKIKNVFSYTGISTKDFCNVSLAYLSLNYEDEKAKKEISKVISMEFHSFEIYSDVDIFRECSTSANDTKGIFVTVSNGDNITYKLDNNSPIVKFQSAGFPLTSVAGNHYIGYAAIKHTIDAYDGLEKQSFLSNRILSLYDGDINRLTYECHKHPEEKYEDAAKIVKELYHRKDNSYQIIYQSFLKLKAKILQIDELSEDLLPIYLNGDLSSMYHPFFEEHLRVSENKVDNEMLAERIFEKLLDSRKVA